MRARQVPPSRVTTNVPSSRATATSAPIGSVSIGGSLIDGPGNANVRSAVTLCVGAAKGLPSAASAIQPT